MAKSKKQPWRLQELSLKDVRDTEFEAAILPFGATEPHNLHLPYGTDTYEIVSICDRACAWAWKKGARVALLPQIPFGANQNTLGFPMTINLDQAVLDEIVAATCESLERHDVFKLVVANGHGGNQFQPGIRSLHGRSPVFVCLVNFYQMMADVGAKLFSESGDHADEMETSLMLALEPELVELKAADDGAVYPSRFEAVRRKWAWHPRQWDLATKNSGVGDPRKATAEKGAKYLKTSEERFGSFLVELAESELDADFPFDRRKAAPPGGEAGGGHA
ncbi:MAG: creatininase family protein [Planctomycetota bacterium]|nr:creatininase family protein [Planctomycetota bacterium]